MSTRFLLLFFLTAFYFSISITAKNLPEEFIDPPHEFSVMPFWFWNDTLKDEEIIRQIADFEEHGVYGFVIHPRVGLPHDIKWLSEEMIRCMHVAIKEASSRDMYVILYDEGMYPSGSSGGQVVERNPEHAARGLAKIDLKDGEELSLDENMKLITIIHRPDGGRVAIVEQPSGGVIRGLHFINEGGEKLQEHTPPAGDLLNPDAVSSFMELVYERFAEEFSDYFGNTILGIFTDEPSPLGRSPKRGMVPGNASLFPQIHKILGYDIIPHLASLWYEDYPDSKKYRTDYHRAINICLEENYYKRLGDWCERNNISLMGHPAGSMDIGTLRYFQIPGQDIVWRYIEPGQKALSGQHSTMAKCASSAMIHQNKRRNSNELYGAYGHELTYNEVEWLANWCFVRGHNLLIPHAFYYSIRGPRFDERPPDVGPNSPWWGKYKPYADACRRLSWINTDSRHICDFAILGEATWLPDNTAKILYQGQRDFNYIEIRHLWEDAKINKKGLELANMNYKAIILDSLSQIPVKAIPILKKLASNKRLLVRRNSGFEHIFRKAIIYQTRDDLLAALDAIPEPDLILNPGSENIRYRHVIKDRNHYYLIFNEEGDEVFTQIKVPPQGNRYWIDQFTTEISEYSPNENVHFKPYEMKILWITDKMPGNYHSQKLIKNTGGGQREIKYNGTTKMHSDE